MVNGFVQISTCVCDSGLKKEDCGRFVFGKIGETSKPKKGANALVQNKEITNAGRARGRHAGQVVLKGLEWETTKNWIEGCHFS